MNSASVVAIFVAFISMLGTALALWVGRTDRATKINRENMDNILKDSRSMRAFREDAWNRDAWARQMLERDGKRDRWEMDVRRIFNDMQQDLMDRGAITQIREIPLNDYGPPPPMPASEVRKLEEGGA